VLKLNPDNVQAQQGLQHLADGYVQWAEEAIAGDDQDVAAGYLEQLVHIDPDHTQLVGLRDKLQALQTRLQ